MLRTVPAEFGREKEKENEKEIDALSPLLGAASARLGPSSLEQQDATIG